MTLTSNNQSTNNIISVFSNRKTYYCLNALHIQCLANLGLDFYNVYLKPYLKRILSSATKGSVHGLSHLPIRPLKITFWHFLTFTLNEPSPLILS